MGDVHYCWGDFGITSEAQFASPVRVPTREVTVTSDRMRPAVWKWSRALLDASFRALVPLHQNRSQHVNFFQAHKAWKKADPQREFIRILVSVCGVHHAGSDFD